MSGGLEKPRFLPQSYFWVIPAGIDLGTKKPFRMSRSVLTVAGDTVLCPAQQNNFSSSASSLYPSGSHGSVKLPFPKRSIDGITSPHNSIQLELLFVLGRSFVQELLGLHSQAVLDRCYNLISYIAAHLPSSAMRRQASSSGGADPESQRSRPLQLCHRGAMYNPLVAYDATRVGPCSHHDAKHHTTQYKRFQNYLVIAFNLYITDVAHIK
ncbi:hypothetical protein BGW80DRAFT_1252007 [Lactifluus volemus]|nr:hypothetical protein BGW80DRAFT_1252007 [Lactifluus volemus]